MAFQPRSYGLVPLPAPADPLRSLSELASVAGQMNYLRQQKGEDLYRQQERARVDEDRTVLRSAQSSPLQPEEVESQLKQLGRGDLVPVYKTWRTDLETARLSLKRLTEEDAERKSVREANYWGAHAAAVKRAQYDPLAIEAVLGEAEQDGYPVEAIRTTLRERPDQLRSIVDRLITDSPVQREIFEKEADRTLSQTREGRLLQESKEREADRSADNARLERDAAAREAERREREADRQRDDEWRRTQSSRPPQVTPAQRALAERTKFTQLKALEKDFARVPVYPEDPPKMTEEELDRQKLEIENSYRAQIGIEPVAELSPEWLGGASLRGRTDGPERRPIPGIDGGEAEFRDGRWIRVK